MRKFERLNNATIYSISVLFVLLVTVLTFETNANATLPNIETTNNDSLRDVQRSNISYIRDSLLLDKDGIIFHYFEKYAPSDCYIQALDISVLSEKIEDAYLTEGIRVSQDSIKVFVIPPMTYCDAGNSYYFSDTTLPRLMTDSYCAHPTSFFVCPDIDEDGVREVGIFYSSCTGRSKSLMIYTLRNNAWLEIAISDFDVLTKSPTEVEFSTLVRKLGKNEFEICNFTEGDTYWERHEMP